MNTAESIMQAKNFSSLRKVASALFYAHEFNAHNGFPFLKQHLKIFLPSQLESAIPDKLAFYQTLLTSFSNRLFKRIIFVYLCSDAISVQQKRIFLKHAAKDDKQSAEWSLQLHHPGFMDIHDKIEKLLINTIHERELYEWANSDGSQVISTFITSPYISRLCNFLCS